MIFYGQKFLRRRKLAAEWALQMLREKDKISALEIARQLGVSEVDVRGYLADSQRQGLIPLKADIV